MGGSSDWRTRGVLLAVVLTVAVAGWIFSADELAPSPPTTAAERVGSEEKSGWLASVEDSATYLDFHRDDVRLVGALQISTLAMGDGGYEVEGRSSAFTGSLEGSELSISVGAAAPWFGSLEDGQLTLHLPQDDGTLAPFMLRPASVADHNAAVALLQARANEWNSADDEAKYHASLDSEADSAMAAYDNAVTELRTAGREAGESGGTSLRDSFDEALASYEESWSEMQSAEATMQSSDCDYISYEAGVVDYARGAIEYSRGGVEYVDAQADSSDARIDAAMSKASTTFDQAAAAATVAGTTGPDRGRLDSISATAAAARADLGAKQAEVHARADEIDAAADALNADAQTWAESHSC